MQNKKNSKEVCRNAKYHIFQTAWKIKKYSSFKKIITRNRAKRYEMMFLKRWKELDGQINLEEDCGEIEPLSFYKNDVFHKVFISPELLVGYYLWRGNGLEIDGGDAECYFELEYDGWEEDCKEIASKARTIFEKELKVEWSEEL